MSLLRHIPRIASVLAGPKTARVYVLIKCSTTAKYTHRLVWQDMAMIACGQLPQDHCILSPIEDVVMSALQHGFVLFKRILPVIKKIPAQEQ